MMRAAIAAWQRFWFTPVDPWSLGFGRFCFFGLLYALYLYQIDLSAYADVPDGFFQPRSFFAWLPFAAPHPDVFRWLVRIFEFSVILSTVGLLTQIATATSCVLSLYVIGLQFNYGYLHWAHALIPITIGIHALAPCGDALSIDAIIRRNRTGHTIHPGGQYRWPIQLVRLIYVTVFVAAGLAKLRTAGLAWVMTDTLRHYLLENLYVYRVTELAAWGHPLAEWLIRQPTLCRILAILVVVLELSAPATLISRRARACLIPALFLFQVGNALLLYQDFFFAYLGLYAFWLPWKNEDVSNRLICYSICQAKKYPRDGERR